MQTETIAVGVVLLAIIGLLLFKYNKMKESRDELQRKFSLKCAENDASTEALNDYSTKNRELVGQLVKQNEKVDALTVELKQAVKDVVEAKVGEINVTRKLVIGQLRRSFPTLAAEVKQKLDW